MRPRTELIGQPVGELRHLKLFGLLADCAGKGQALLGQVNCQAKRPLDCHFPVAEGFIGEDLRLLALLECKECAADVCDVFLGQLAVLLAEVLPERLEPLCGIDQLHLASALRRLAVAQHPHVGGDARVVEQVERQGHDRLQPVVLENPAADVALALAGVAGEQRRAVVHLGYAAAQRGSLFHLRQHARQEQQLAIARARHQRVFGVARVLDHEARVAHPLLAAHALQVGLPTLPVGRVGDHEVELAGRERVVGQRGSLRPARDVVGSLALSFQ